ncbi:MAG: fumarate hydratase [Fidelibacterota bacterium]|nr:MAG: fumarate hydratase [Candidatus Neomarinimicrobiota bacterium]
MISRETIHATAFELNRLAAIQIPGDARQAVGRMYKRETNKISKYVLGQILENYRIAVDEQRPMCADTGLPRFYVKVGNEAAVEGGMVALEGAIRQATAEATAAIPIRPNRVHPISRHDYNNNVGVHAPTVDYSFEPNVGWLELTAVHKGGLFGGDYRMLFPADGIPGLKRFFLDCISEFFRRGMSCQPLVVGIGIGGTKDTCVRLAKEAGCLRIVGDRNPEPEIAALEEELLQLGNSTGFGVMGLPGDGAIMDVHIEIAYAHTGGMPVAIQHFCFAHRRMSARIEGDGSVHYREDPGWFTPFYRRDSVGFEELEEQEA